MQCANLRLMGPVLQEGINRTLSAGFWNIISGLQEKKMEGLG